MKKWALYPGAFLAAGGMVSLVFDPIEQGERFQLFKQKPKLCSVPGHTMSGIGSILLG